MSTQEHKNDPTKVDFRKIYEDVYGEWSYTSTDPVDPAKTALVIIDAQPAFTDSSIGYMKAHGMKLKTSMEYFDERVCEVALPNIAKLLEFFREQGLLIIYSVTWSETENLSDMDNLWRRAIHKWETVLGEQIWRRWNEGMYVREEIAPRDRELVLNKRTASAFSSSLLPLVLKNAAIETVVLTGFNTNGCVFETACVGSNLGYDFIIPGDATACFAQTLQDEAEVWLSRHYGAVCTTEQAIELLLKAWENE